MDSLQKRHDCILLWVPGDSASKGLSRLEESKHCKHYPRGTDTDTCERHRQESRKEHKHIHTQSRENVNWEQLATISQIKN